MPSALIGIGFLILCFVCFCEAYNRWNRMQQQVRVSKALSKAHEDFQNGRISGHEFLKIQDRYYR